MQTRPFSLCFSLYVQEWFRTFLGASLMFLSKCFLCGLPWCTGMQSQTHQGNGARNCTQDSLISSRENHLQSYAYLYSHLPVDLGSFLYMYDSRKNSNQGHDFKYFFLQIYIYFFRISFLNKSLKLLGAIVTCTCIKTCINMVCSTIFLLIFFLLKKNRYLSYFEVSSGQSSIYNIHNGIQL